MLTYIVETASEIEVSIVCSEPILANLTFLVSLFIKRVFISAIELGNAVKLKELAGPVC